MDNAQQFGVGFLPWLPCPPHAQRKAPPVLERFDRRGDFQHRITHRRQAIAFVGLREQFRFQHARLVSEREEFHRLAGDLVMRPLFQRPHGVNTPFREVVAVLTVRMYVN